MAASRKRSGRLSRASRNSADRMQREGLHLGRAERRAAPCPPFRGGGHAPLCPPYNSQRGDNFPEKKLSPLLNPHLSFTHPAHRGAPSRGVLVAEQAGGGTGEQVLKSGGGRPAIPGLGRCGARAAGSQPRTRAASGLRPGTQRSPARSWLTAAQMRRESAARRRKENAAAERREARRPASLGR